MPNRPQDAVQLELPLHPPPIVAPDPVRTRKRWVLVDVFATERNGAPVYFEKMTGIGPRCTVELELAEKFETKLDAACELGWERHLMSFWKPQEVEVGE